MAVIPTIAEASRRIAAKDISPVELAHGCLDRAARLDPALHAFLLVAEDRAMADARAAEARAMRGARRGPLDGIPIVHKDIYGTAGIRTTAHSRVLMEHVPKEDATTVRKLAEAGTVMLGKVATHEFAMGGPSFDLPWPAARNPWNPAHFTGGSSSGTGAAVAAGLALGGTGSDTGGSIRSPASFCGLAGIKPTYGRVSRAGILPLAFSLDHAGPLAWTAEDCALLLGAMAGHDPADPASADCPVPDYAAALREDARGLRIGVVRHWHEDDTETTPATAEAVARAAETFRGLGAELGEVRLPHLLEWGACNTVILLTEAYAIHAPWLSTRFAEYGELFRDRLVLAALISGPDYVAALRRRRELCRAMARGMAGFDLLLTASTPGEAPRIDAVPKWSPPDKPSFSPPGNITGYPAISVCGGFGPSGLPLGIQLIARPFEEAALLAAAHAFERATGFRDHRPKMTEAL
jgi:aspartyl-tRNA(Asn)/glutamyl-tRNA(Gln) amidotransferase subunit A